MRLHFDPDLDHQRQAIEAVCDLFRGQEPTGWGAGDLAVGNRLTLSDAGILENLSGVQRRNGLAPAEALRARDFSIEMETGTGKTYVYLRTIFELNERYGFTKFVIVVPSVAIKEGVSKTLEITRHHFASLYAGVPFESFVYDSTRLGRVRDFATSAGIRIMIVTVGAINKRDVNNLYKPNENTGGEEPIELIRATRPIVIVDEPQSVDGGLQGRGKRALDAMDPLCTLRYSATHVDEHHRVYRLGAVDAYERRLVKQIEVASATLEDAHNRPYLRLVSVRGRGARIGAKVELDIETGAGVRRREVAVRDGDDLERTTGRAVYAGCRIAEIRVARGDERIELRAPDGDHRLRLGQAYGDVDLLAVQREMIRRTIREHLDKEERLRPRGIKVLSLIFVDEVAKYRHYDADGRPLKGPYARIFEDEYQRLAQHPAWRARFAGVDLPRAAEEVHGGYFSIDRSGSWSDAAESDRAHREDAERAYALIMKDKERLLSFDTPLAFVFSHSALREGWDNPNVFQICTLRNLRTERERRQTIGRGLRLCVDQAGRRVAGFEVNTLTVVANESYEQFAEGLQREIEEETGTRFGGGEPGSSGGRIVIGNADTRRRAGSGDEAELDAELGALWERVRRNTAYRVRFDCEKLVERCIGALRAAPPVSGPRLQWRVAAIGLGKAGVEAAERGEAADAALPETEPELPDAEPELPDVLRELQERTQLTRRSLHRVLTESGRLADFARNPQAFIELAGDAIAGARRHALGDGVRYQRLGDASCYAQELFEPDELRRVESAPTDPPDGGGRVTVYAPLPGWLKVPTPLGDFHPERAVRVDAGDEERLYFVAARDPERSDGS